MNDLKEELRTVHRPLTLLPENLPGEVLLPERVRIGGGGDEVSERAAQDFCAFLRGAGIGAERGGEDAFFRLVVDPALPSGTYELEVSENGCRIAGQNSRKLAQGVYRVEYELRERRARALSIGKRKFEMPYSPRMVHSAYGLDDYPDEYLSLLAHEGYDAILLFVKGVNQSAGGALDFNELVRRAAEYGIDVYGYCYIPNFTHPAEEGAAERYDALYGSVFRECPGLKGMVFVGESVEFPLKTNADARGSFTELLKTNSCGQFSVNISKPGITKGEHWHQSKWEFFIVVKGHARIQQRKIGSKEVLNFDVSGEEMKAVHMLPGYTHNIINLSDTEELVTLMWANELFDPAHPDTYAEKVEERNHEH